MDTPSHLVRNPTLLPPGTVVGTWRVEAWAGCGVYGAVYRAVSVNDPLAAPVALKLAVHAADPRFDREVELLSRCHDPSIPRLLDHGSWRSPSGALHPFLIMQWVEGVSSQPAQPTRDEHGIWQVDDVLLPPSLLKPLRKRSRRGRVHPMRGPRGWVTPPWRRPWRASPLPPPKRR